jgi:hypothetical protein
VAGATVISLLLGRRLLPLRFKAITVLAFGEPDYSPHHTTAGLAHAFNPVIPVLEDELTAPRSDDHGRWFPTLLSKFLHSLNSVVPILVIDWA